ncbi:MAG: glycerophosphodiester phosphodiesterase family protein [Hyphomonas sp.]
MRHLLLAGLSLALIGCAAPPAPSESQTRADVIVIAHRGASGELPEHTIEAYKLAIEQGADYIEPDLVMTSDGVLVARHDPWLSDSTDVADRPEFADRRTTVTSPDGQELTDWFAWDFILEELKTLRARQVRAGRPKEHDNLWPIPTYAEIVALSEAERAATGRIVGLYPETKWPGHHRDRGLDMTAAMEAALREAGHDHAGAPVYVQSFEPFILIELKERVATPLVQLVYPMGYAPGAAPSVDLETLAAYADGVGPFKWMVIDPRTGASTGYAEKARALGLEVHPWTFRDDDRPGWAATPEDEIRAVIDAGATGFFTDFSDTGRRAVDGAR